MTKHIGLKTMNQGTALATGIHGELLKLGFDVAQSTVSKYMVPRRDRPSHGGRRCCAGRA